MAAREDVPSTLKRSSKKAQETYAKTHDSAVEQYGEGERAHRTALAALKRTHEKRGDRWVAKREPGPSELTLRHLRSPLDAEATGSVVQLLPGVLLDVDAAERLSFAAAQRVEHYEIAGYGTARQLADDCGLDSIKDLMDQTLDEESQADKLLTKIATGGLFKAGVNQQATT